MKYCQNCGAQCEDSAKFCVNCGVAVQETQSTAQQTNEQQTNYTYNQNVYTNNVVYQNGPSNHMITPRNIVLAVVLTIVTCGIYGIYWMIKLNDEINCLADDPTAASGGMVFVLSLVTCGIYSFFWLYKMGEKCDRIKGVDENSRFLYLVCGILGFSIVSYCLMQDTINRAV